MNREIAFNPKLICDVCGKIGSFDLRGDFLCIPCVIKEDELRSEGIGHLDEEGNYPGKGCVCYAHTGWECSCGVDWTDPEIYQLRDIVKELEQEIKELKDPIYCPVCGNCGEKGCCGTERCLYPQDTPDTLEYLDELEDKLERLNG